ncbi:MAG: HAD family hydrolase [Anaerolineales bacterium]
MIAFDADDTLWHNETRYAKAKEDFGELLTTYQSAEKAKQFLDQIEVRNIELYGYGMKSFTLSMIEAAIELSDGKISGNELRSILDLARTVLNAEVELFPRVQETIAGLAKYYPLLLITKGDASEQERKIQRSGLEPYFQAVEIVHDKTLSTYRSVIQKYHLTPELFVMVGNSLRSDIFPVVQLGGIAVHIPQASTWFHENLVEGDLDDKDYYQLEHIGQLPDLLETIKKKLI